MFSLHNISDIALPDKTLCLTYDDGPGPDSAEIGRFLRERGVRATFFVVGKFALEHPQVLERLHDDGHLIGNHTFEHPDMPYYVSVGGDVRDQVIRTNTLIQKYNQGRPIYLRATYGKWSPEVAKELNVDIRCSFRHVGPVYWDIAGIDCEYWRLGKSVQEATEAYLNDISAKRKGVIVMHDGIADMDTVAAHNRTLDLTRQLVPRLQDMGFRFVGLDEIDDPQLKTPLADTFALRGAHGRFLQHDGTEGSTLAWTGQAVQATGSQFVMEPRGRGKVVLRTAEGKYLQVDPDVDQTVRLGTKYNVFSLFDSIPVSAGEMMFRTHNGNYLAAETPQGGLLKANARFMRQAWCIRYVPATSAYLKPLSFAQKLKRLHRQALFVKSKLLQS